MLVGFSNGGLEMRMEGGETRLSGRFPYNKRAVLSDGGRTGRPRKESIASRAFAYRVDKPDEDIHLLSGHDYGKPLASRGAGTLDLRDTDDALIFEARISEEMREVSYVRDALSALSAGLIAGISPGFRLPPKRRVEKPETITDEGMDPKNGAFNAIIRTVNIALLYELSLVTRPAYDETQIEMRSWETNGKQPVANFTPHSRWR
ncbi:HK97 family phage prohead protease [Aliiroseovarius sp. 2305UL8-7]|uniref:HK97 family phage prohead protease n=1 Tax=Aliiroseovarius conchicola TaxID=3121637 RepID=UPI003527EB9F